MITLHSQTFLGPSNAAFFTSGKHRPWSCVTPFSLIFNTVFPKQSKQSCLINFVCYSGVTETVVKCLTLKKQINKILTCPANVNRLKLLLDLEEMFDDLNGTAIVDLED